MQAAAGAQQKEPGAFRRITKIKLKSVQSIRNCDSMEKFDGKKLAEDYLK